MPNMQIRMLTHIGICVSDLSRSVAFYRDLLGCKEVGRLLADGATTDRILALEGTELEAVYLERDGFRLELLHYRSPGHRGPASPRPMNQLGLTHISLRVDDIDAVLAAIEAAGGVILRERLEPNPVGATRVEMVTDPDGMLIELIDAPGDPAAIPTMPEE